jgi:hypothetical protein
MIEKQTPTNTHTTEKKTMKTIRTKIDKYICGRIKTHKGNSTEHKKQ